MAGSHPSRRRGRLAGLKPILCAALPVLLLSVFVPAAKAETCWGFDGRQMVNNRVCPGSKSCCGESATCLSNRLCHNDGDPANLWIRGPCFTKGWNETSAECPQICAYSETETNRMPRVTMCSDGSLCCDNEKNCCAQGKGIFLDESGNRVFARATGATTSYPPDTSSTSSRTATSSTSAASTGTTTTGAASASGTQTSSDPNGAGGFTATGFGPSSTAQATTDSSSSSSDSDTVGLKVGLGLGIPLAVLISGLLVFLFLRKRNAAARQAGHGGEAGAAAGGGLDGGSDSSSPGAYYQTVATADRPEMHGHATGYYAEAPANYKPGVVGVGYADFVEREAKSASATVTMAASGYQPAELGAETANELMGHEMGGNNNNNNNNNGYNDNNNANIMSQQQQQQQQQQQHQQQAPPPRYYELG
ncbi:hypothetical protein QBC42DRAFT_350718 [Cladorrhinum samala]|uniref:Mid2 domain-containing protein n=1 Tax=Cladorrhinum samala TaxID=585594 RepID=A0AAV9H999_9PEZI|nr:hypothetical protein QBC42DRAFT_350718 [Cladorrhinum samala]